MCYWPLPNVHALNRSFGLQMCMFGSSVVLNDGSNNDCSCLMHINARLFKLGILGVDLSRLIPGILIISMNSGAYVSETVRAGINAFPKGAVRGCIFSSIRPKNAMRYVILPQAIKKYSSSSWKRIYHHYQDSSLLSAIGVMELWNGATTVATTTYLPLTHFLFAAFYYLIMTSVLTVALKAFENILDKETRNNDRNLD